MGVMMRILLVATLLGIAVVYQNYRNLSRPLPVPEMDFNAYWGPGSGVGHKDDTAVRAFDITAKPELLEDLQTQLNRPLKLHEPLEGVGFEYGFNSKQLEKIVSYWRDIYLPKWTSEREKYLKQFPHFQTQIQGLKIHFLHIKPKKTDGKKVIPLLLLHGWPGSVREFYDIIPMLTTPNAKSDYVFEVVAPSLPGYGWSQGASKIGFGPAEISIVMRNLMLRLGFEKFAIQGGDWGSIIGSNLATFFPQNALGYHSNMCGAASPLANIKLMISTLCPSYFYEKDQVEFHLPATKIFNVILEEMGYFHIQATKPDTIGAALAYNPIGLAAYIMEKFSTWTNGEWRTVPDGGLTMKFTLDQLLDNVMIYYVSNSITTSVRLYSEAFTKSQMALSLDRVPVTVPVGCARFKYDLVHSSDWQLEEKYVNLVTSTYYRKGGHFAAMEEPEVLYNDFVKYANKAFKGSTLKIHFLHVKPKKTDGKQVIPLLLLHGWPGSVREFYDIVPMLTTPNAKSDYVFEVVVPSLPGYGWSQGASKVDFGPPQISIVLRNLMLRLGYKKFAIQGGDWGSVIGSNLATLFPQNVLGYHSNMCINYSPIAYIRLMISTLWPSYYYEKDQVEFHLPATKTFSMILEEMGYFHIQATKPDTIGAALAYNPIGLAAYIMEKFSTWTNGEWRTVPDGGLTMKFTLDQLLDNVMIYYVSNSITTSVRLYSETFTKSQMALGLDRVPVTVPVGCARFKHDLAHFSDWQLKEKFVNLVTSTYHKNGGHFIAMEEPEILYNDFVQFANKAFKGSS